MFDNKLGRFYWSIEKEGSLVDGLKLFLEEEELFDEDWVPFTERKKVVLEKVSWCVEKKTQIVPLVEMFDDGALSILRDLPSKGITTVTIEYEE